MIHIYEPPRFFDARQYEEEVLQLAQGTTEDDLDEHIRAEAQGLGLSLKHSSLEVYFAHGDPRSSNRSSTGSTSTGVTRAHSIDSRNSFSTDITSNQSIRSSRDLRRPTLFSLPLRSFCRSSINDEYSNSRRSSVVSTNQSNSSICSSIQSPRSSISLTPSYQNSARKPFSVRRHLRLSKFRRSSQSEDEFQICLRCRELSLQAQATYRLQCGHGFCHDHLLEIMGERAIGAETRLGHCCLKQISGTAIQSVVLSYRSSQANPSDAGPSLAITPENPQISAPVVGSPPRALPSHIVQVWTSQQQLGETFEKHREIASSIPEFNELRDEQSSILARSVTFLDKIRALLVEHHKNYRSERLNQQRQQLAELHDTHHQILSHLEDKHVAAEADLRELHDQEQNNCSLALRHMEGYMRTHDPDGSGRTITDQDRKELEKQYWLRDNMEIRHKNAINVLREQQARHVRTKAQAQEKECAVLQLRNQREMSHLDRTFEAETQELEELGSRRRARLMARFALQDEIWRRRHNEKTTHVGARDPSDSSLIPFPIPPIQPVTSAAINL